MKRVLIISVMVTFAIVFALSGQASAGEKVFASSGSWEVFGPQFDLTLLSTQVNVTGNHKDLLIDFSAETAVYFSDYDYITNYLSDNDYLEAIIVVWVEIDGERVPIVPSTNDRGNVVFRHLFESQYNWVGTWGATTTTIENQFERRRTANSFKWFAIDPGTGWHTVEIKAAIMEFTSGLDGYLDAIVGVRTMMVEQVDIQ